MLKPSIPLIDLRDKTLVDLLRAYPDKAHALVRSAGGSFGFWSRMACFFGMRLADKASHAWLKRTKNPYLHEIESFADILECRGVYALNLSYEWGCSGGVYRAEGAVAMLRVLDWPLPDLGKHTIVAWQRGKAGEFYNLTWPGLSGVVNAMAPGRFCGAVNLAPMRGHGRGLIGDWLTNRRIARRQEGLPPAHLMRQAFEQAQDYDTAKRMLAEIPIAVPAIFLLSGIEAGQGCVIERLENRAEIRELGASQNVCASNHFVSPLNGTARSWRPRELDSAGRLRQCITFHGHELQTGQFGWLQAPVINRFTRLCVVGDAADARLTAQGYEGMAPVTEPFALRAEAPERGPYMDDNVAYIDHATITEGEIPAEAEVF